MWVVDLRVCLYVSNAVSIRFSLVTYENLSLLCYWILLSLLGAVGNHILTLYSVSSVIPSVKRTLEA